MFHVDNSNSAGDNHSEEMDLDQSLNSEEDPNPSPTDNNDSDSENNEDSQGVSTEERASVSESFDDSNNEEPNLEETNNEEPNLGNFTNGISRLELSKIIEDSVKSAFASKEETRDQLDKTSGKSASYIDEE